MYITPIQFKHTFRVLLRVNCLTLHHYYYISKLDNTGKQGNDGTLGNDSKQGNEGKGLSHVPYLTYS